MRQLKHIGVRVRASHERSSDQNSKRPWQHLELEPIRYLTGKVSSVIYQNVTLGGIMA
ncbi:MAG: hypothetical protein VKL41_18810 [Snowella sp.]|nr:hypothetical protein [Snowella sp.]